MKHLVFSFKAFVPLGRSEAEAARALSTHCSKVRAERVHLGKTGETLAQKYLESLGYRLIECNYHCREGELDLIVSLPDKHEIVFVEVKTRRTDYFGQPEDSLTRTKKRRLLRAIYSFRQKQNRKISWRLDLIAVKFVSARRAEIRHYKNVLGTD